MNGGKKLVTLLVVIICGLSLVLAPLVSRVLLTQAAVTWTKYAGEVTLDSEPYVVDAWVIRNGSSYEMWYTHGKTDLSVTEIVDSIADLDLGDLIDDIEDLDFEQFLGHLDDLDVGDIKDLLDATTTVIGYATSTNGKTWTVQDDEVLSSGGSAWNSVGAPCVVKGSTYEMWYTRVKSDLTQADLENILANMGTQGQRKDALLDLLDSTTTVIGYATSNDGINWADVDDEVLPSGGSAWSSVADPSVIKNSATDYEMWYTQGKTDVTQADLDALDAGDFDVDDLLDIMDGTHTVIGYATSSDGETWAVQNDEALFGGSDGIWDSVADPSVVKGSTYEMWYTQGSTDLVKADFQDLLDEIAAEANDFWDILNAFGAGDFEALLNELNDLDISTVKALLSDTNTAIGYATSNDGETWTVQSSQHLTGSSNDAWSSVAAPSVVKTGDTYEMWYTEGVDDFAFQDILDLVLGDDLPIGYAYYTPSPPSGGALPSEDYEDMDPEDAAALLDDMDPEDAADILADMDPDNAAAILAEMDPEDAAAILEEMDIGDAIDILGEMDVGDAAGILGEMGSDAAAGILEEVGAEEAAEILGEMDAETAAAVMEGLTTGSLTDVILGMSEEVLTDVLPGLSPETLYSIDPEVLFDSLPNVSTEQLISEDPPQPPTGAGPPIIVYTTPSGARYLAIRTWSGEWVVMMATPPPIEQLLIKTKRALTDVETIVEIFEEQPSAVAVSLPTGQIVWAYFDISFENIEPEDVELGHITFYVEKDWLEENSIHKWSVVLNRYDPELEQWIALPTKRVEEDSTDVYYTAIITQFSIFAISGSETLPPVNFEIDDLVVDPVEATADGATITISADITNISDEDGTYVATLWIDDTIEAGQDVYLEADETKPVSFTVTRQVVGSYEVRLDRLYGSFSIAEVEAVEPVAIFVPTILTIAPSHVEAGGVVTISVIITNVGDPTDSYTVTLKIDNVVEATTDITLAGHTSEKVTFTTSKSIIGTYLVVVDGLSGTFEVKAPPPPPPPSAVNWPILIGVIVGVIIIGVFIGWAAARRTAD